MPEGEGEEQEIESLFEKIMKENFPNLAKEIDFQEIREAHRVPKKLGPRRNTPRHIIITLAKIKEKERILKAAREKETLTYKGVPMKLSADFSKETSQARRGWKEVFKVMQSKDLHPRLLYPAKLSFRMDRQIKCFPDKVKLKEFIITQCLLYEMLKGVPKKKKIKNMNSKMTTNSQLSINEPKRKEKQLEQKLNKLEQEQNQSNRDHMEGFQWGWGGEGLQGKV